MAIGMGLMKYSEMPLGSARLLSLSLAATGRLNNTGRSLSNAKYTSHLQVKDQRSIAAADCWVIDHEFHHQHALSNSLLLSDHQQHHDRESLSIIARSILLSDCCMGSDRSLSCG
jgi:hypothetical protein